jgi:hypothetical protein
MATNKEVSCIGSAQDKLQIIKNRDATPAENRKMIELASTEEGKKIVAFAKDSKRNKLVVKGANGPVVFSKVKGIYDSDPNTSLVKITDEKAAFPYNTHLVAMDKETGISIPCVQMLIGSDSCPLFTYGASQDELEQRAILNSAVIQAQLKDTENYAKTQKKKVMAKIKNEEVEKDSHYWDTYIAPLGHATSEMKAVLFGRYGLLLANMLQIMTNGIFTMFNTVYPQLFEIDYQLGAAMGSLRAMKHEKITLDSCLEILMKKKPINLPMVPALWLLRLYVNKNKIFKYVPNPIIYIPGVNHMMIEKTESFNIAHVFEKINESVSLADLQIHETIKGRDFNWHFCSGNNPAPEQSFEEKVVFLVVEFKCIEEAFESLFSASGNSMIISIISECRQLYLNALTLVLQNSGAIESTPFILDGTNPGSFISILTNAKDNDLLYQEENKAVSMEARQQQIVESWKELLPAKRIMTRTLPIGFYKTADSEEVIDARGENKFSCGRSAVGFDFCAVRIAEGIEYNDDE